ncbi:aa3-type cytochrome c oxidase subunit IV [Croceicoccus sp. YJ47]|nr:aa3-type cytochrome c oxidase subunit IV [Croceicoccus sp. YJ47]QQN73653.1 aa3-type cytochrome c oxidase subunit IV [Croceicoccus sp. YJ47]
MAKRNDINAAKETYEGFIGYAKWGAIAVAVLAAIVVWIIA